MLRALVEAGIVPDLVLGCSVGAINGAGFAAEPSLRGVARLERMWRKLADGDPELMPGGFIPLAVQLARKGEALHDHDVLQQILEEELPAADFNELRIPFQCVATDLDTATEHWFTDGPIVPALLASASLPAVYPALEHGGRTFIDGGVLNEVHTDRATEWGATELYVLHVGHLDSRPTEVQRPFDSAMRAYWTARRFRLEENLRRVPPHCVVHRLPSGSPPRLRFDDFTQGPDLAELAYNQTAEYLETGRMPEPVVSDAPVAQDEDDDAPAVLAHVDGADAGSDGDGRSAPDTASRLEADNTGFVDALADDDAEARGSEPKQ